MLLEARQLPFPCSWGVPGAAPAPLLPQGCDWILCRKPASTAVTCACLPLLAR